jgi:hypothetical protein
LQLTVDCPKLHSSQPFPNSFCTDGTQFQERRYFPVSISFVLKVRMSQRRNAMDSIFYIIGVVVVVLFVIGFMRRRV